MVICFINMSYRSCLCGNIKYYIFKKFLLSSFIIVRQSQSQEDAWQDPIQEKDRRSTEPWKARATDPSHQRCLSSDSRNNAPTASPFTGQGSQTQFSSIDRDSLHPIQGHPYPGASVYIPLLGQGNPRRSARQISIPLWVSSRNFGLVFHLGIQIFHTKDRIPVAGVLWHTDEPWDGVQASVKGHQGAWARDGGDR